jgi:hypothetical protein
VCCRDSSPNFCFLPLWITQPMPSWFREPTTHVTDSKGTDGGSKLFRDGMSGSSSLLSSVTQWPSSSSISYANKSNVSGTWDAFCSSHSLGESSYMSILHANLLGVNRDIHSSGSSFRDRDRHNHRMLLCVNHFPV